MASISLHPALDQGLQQAAPDFRGGTLICDCADQPVTVRINSQVLHNHACGCTKCWKPKGALFSLVGVVPQDKVEVTANGHKLQVVDTSATIQRHACRQCGVHLQGIIEKEHAFKGLAFIHTERSRDAGWAPPEFAAFVSSVIGSGASPSDMPAIRGRLKELGLEPYDCLSPPLMDAIATYTAKQAGVLRA